MATPEQGTHFWLMTVQTPHPGGGTSVSTRWGDITPGIDDTRESIFRLLFEAIDPSANVLAFDLQPNQL